ncbi:hypothetical protein C8R43DRAFT_1236337 [Mycena crocata]|nr:hypothetical protein C8R43DRAFT_1236337 [Mycena crocata]
MEDPHDEAVQLATIRYAGTDAYNICDALPVLQSTIWHALTTKDEDWAIDHPCIAHPIEYYSFAGKSEREHVISRMCFENIADKPPGWAMTLYNVLRSSGVSHAIIKSIDDLLLKPNLKRIDGGWDAFLGAVFTEVYEKDSQLFYDWLSLLYRPLFRIAEDAFISRCDTHGPKHVPGSLTNVGKAAKASMAFLKNFQQVQLPRQAAFGPAPKESPIYPSGFDPHSMLSQTPTFVSSGTTTATPDSATLRRRTRFIWNGPVATPDIESTPVFSIPMSPAAPVKSLGSTPYGSGFNVPGVDLRSHFEASAKYWGEHPVQADDGWFHGTAGLEPALEIEGGQCEDRVFGGERPDPVLRRTPLSPYNGSPAAGPSRLKSPRFCD